MLNRLLDRLAGQTNRLAPAAILLAALAGGLTVRTALTAPPPAPSPTPSPSPTARAAVALDATTTPEVAATERPVATAPTPIPTLAPRAPTATPEPAQWQGRARSEVIIREEPSTNALPTGLLLTGETAILDQEIVGEEVEPGQSTWYVVRAGIMSGYVYGPLIEPGPRPDETPTPRP